MQPALNPDDTLFHGATYDVEKDKQRFTGQIKRIAEVLNDGQEYGSGDLCKLANVSFSALRNRISDLRVYHGFNIEAMRVHDGLWSYRYKGRMTSEEHRRYLQKLRKVKPIGNVGMFGEMMRSIYAYGHQPDLFNDAAMHYATMKWARDMAERIKDQL